MLSPYDQFNVCSRDTFRLAKITYSPISIKAYEAFDNTIEKKE